MTAPAQANVTVMRCPACGQRIDPPGASRCPLCRFSFGPGGDERVTGTDVTPYAKSYSEGEPGWWRMCRWVWTAPNERLKHLALMRSSAAARTFALHTSLWIALGLAIFQGTRVGWKWIRGLAEMQAGAPVKPLGRGWLHAAGVTKPLPPGFPADSPADLWWNPAQAMIGAVIAGISGLLLLWIVRHVLGLGIGLAHRRSYRGEQRMSAAVLYSTAWSVPALIGAWLCILRPFAFVGQVSRWSWAPTDRTVAMLAGTIVAFSAIFWWIWLIRLGATAPHATRTRVMGFFLLVAPAIALGSAAGWWYGLDWLYERLFLQLNMHF